MTSTHSPEPEQPKFTPESTEKTHSKPLGPGPELRREREAKNMAVSEVASLLRLDISVIKALEANDVDKLPSATFVKGYLRAYARLLNLDGEKLVMAYSASTEDTESPINIGASALPKPARSKRWLWLLLAIVAIVLLAWHWSSPSDQPVSTDSITSESEPTAAPLTNADLGFSQAQAVQARDEDEKPDEVVEQLLRGLQDSQVTLPTRQQESPTEVQVDSVVNEPAVVVNEEPGTVEINSQPEPAIEETPVAVAEPESADEFVVLTLTANEASWVSIRDAREKRVFRNLLKPGAVKEVSGKAPLLIHFGYAQGVALEVNGEAYDHSSWHKSNGTARFVLNPVE